MQNLFKTTKSFSVEFKLLWEKLKNFFYPLSCLGCEKEEFLLCEQCKSRIITKIEQECPYCYEKNLRGEICKTCKNKNPTLDGLLAFNDYCKESLLIKVLHTFKYDLVKELHEPLSQLLGNFFKEKWLVKNAESKFYEQASEVFAQVESTVKLSQIPIIFCPVPLHVQREKQRGFNQAELLLKYLPEESPFRKISLLQRISFKKIQKDLNRQQRIKNVEGAFSAEILQKILKADQLPVPEIVILVDDVATTLATLEACGKELKKNGVKKVYGLVLARKKLL